MRNPSDLPPRGPSGFRRPNFRFKRPGKGRIIVSSIIAALVLLVVFAKSLSGFFTNVLWFDAVGRGDVYWGMLSAKVELAVIFAVGFAAVAWLNFFVADRMAPVIIPSTPEDRALERLRDILAPRRAMLRVVIAVVLGIIAGLPAAAHWEEWLLFRNSQAFGSNDPQFDTNVGFYVFRLPFAQFVVTWAFASLVFIIFCVVALHFLNGAIRPQARANRLSAQSKVHISVLLAAAALLRAADYWLGRFDLTRSSRGVVQGALYTDVKAQLPATNLMILVSVAVAALLLWNVRQKGWRLPALAVGLWVVVALIAGTVYPAIIQRFVVQPNVSTRELPYIDRNIKATKQALGIDDVTRVDTKIEEISTSDVVANDIALRDIRQLDVTSMRDRFALDKGLTSFYAVRDLDVDRYSVDGRLQQVIVATRELNSDGIPNKTWVSRHLLYTHGCGVIAAPASVVTADGRPSYVDLKVTRPEIYFGERLSQYALVNTDQNEQACPDGTSSAHPATTGVKVNSTLRRIALAINFGEYNLFGSRLITEDSSIMWVRDVRNRVQKIAPFLHVDSDPYPVVTQGKVQWVVDLFTTTNRYPYAENADTSQLGSNSGLKHSLNYVRNSVKAVVDAYTGEVTFYVVDPQDPIIRAWRSAFPKMFKPVSAADPDLVAHFRYPEDLFRLQSNAYGRYQFDDPAQFFNRDAAWTVAQDVPRVPEGQVSAVTTTTVAGAQSESINTSEFATERIAPYYTLFHAPGEKASNGVFSMLRSFVPYSADDSRKELRALMVVSSESATYGKITVYDMQSPLPPGPGTVAAEFDSDPTISEEITPLDLRGSRVLFGDLQVLPVAKGLVFIRPLFVLPEGNESKQVFVRKMLGYYNGSAVIGDSVTEVVSRLFPGFNLDLGDRVGSVTTTTTPGSTPSTTVPSGGSTTQTPAQLLAQADKLFSEADAALAKSPPDFATYQSKLAQARELVRKALSGLK